MLCFRTGVIWIWVFVRLGEGCGVEIWPFLHIWNIFESFVLSDHLKKDKLRSSQSIFFGDREGAENRSIARQTIGLYCAKASISKAAWKVEFFGRDWVPVESRMARVACLEPSSLHWQQGQNPTLSKHTKTASNWKITTLEMLNNY